MAPKRSFDDIYPTKDSYKRFDQRNTSFGRALKDTGRIVEFGSDEYRADKIRQSLPGFGVVEYAFNGAAGMYEAGKITPLANFEATGPVARATTQAMSWSGAHDLAGNVKEWVWNAAAERLFGIPASLALGRSIFELTESTVMGGGSAEKDPRETAFATGSWRGRRIERARIGPHAGREVIVEAALSRVDTADGEVVGIMSVRRDVTASVRLEEEFAALGRLATTTGVARTRRQMGDEAIRLLCAATGAEFGLVTRHEGATAVIDGALELSPGLAASIRQHPVAASPLTAALRRPGDVLIGRVEDLPMRPDSRDELLGGGIASLAAVGMHHQGELVGILALGWRAESLLRPSEPALLQAASHLEHALRNRRLLASLVASEQRYRTLFDASPEALLLVTSAGEIVDANAAAHRTFRAERGWLLGRAASEVTGARLSDLQAGAAPERHDGRSVARTSGVAADGASMPVELHVAPVEIDGTSRLLILVRDLTAEAELQAELVQAQKMDALGQLVSGVAHELNNPLAAIVAFSQLIRRDPSLPEALRRDAATLNQEADRTRRIVQNLLDFARQRPPERHPTRLDALVRTVLELQAYNLSTGQIEVEVDIPPTLPIVPVDRSQLQQVMLNLTQNAMQAIASVRDHGRISIVGRAADGNQAGNPARSMVRLTITDDGPGVAEDHRERLFMPFFSTKAPGEGTGLGLPVSFGIVAAHGGQLRFEPGPGGIGAAFIVELPTAVTPTGREQFVPGDFDPRLASEIADPEGPASLAAGDAAKGGDTARRGAPSGRATILVLDDESTIRRLLVKVLDAAGFRPLTAAAGPEAIATVRAGGIDAVMCDHRMAGMSGIEVYEAIVAIDPSLAERFVFMSGDVLNPELRSFSRRHDVGLLAKPFDVEAAVEAVKGLLANHPTPSSR